jgi:hypothetical protein
MIRRAFLTLTLGALLSGCFFSLDGSLVDKKRDAGARDASIEAKPGWDQLPGEGPPPSEGGAVDQTPSDRFTSKVDHRPQGG